MSHFGVLVIGPNVEDQLAPYHEFECTGINDQFIQDLDETEEHRNSYENGTKSRVRLADGVIIDADDDACYRDPTEDESKKLGPVSGSGWCGPIGALYKSKDWGDGKGYRKKVQFTPDGAEEVEVPYPQVMTLREYIAEYCEISVVPHGGKLDTEEKHKFGYATLTEEGEIDKVIRRTNPDKKWDWWVIGGRWRDSLTLKSGAKADSAIKADIDFEAMRNEAGNKAAERWDKAAAAKVAAGLSENTKWEPWSEVGPRTGYDDLARNIYNGQPAVDALQKAFNNPFHKIDQYLTPRDQYIQQARDDAMVFYALVKDAKWLAKGEMGWFGMSDNKVSEKDWSREVNKMLDELPDDTQITVVDCHI